MIYENGADEKLQLSKWYHIRTCYIPAKLAYFLLGVTKGIIQPYANLFLINAGLPPSLAGTVSGVSMLVWFLGALMWGTVSWSCLEQLDQETVFRRIHYRCMVDQN